MDRSPGNESSAPKAAPGVVTTTGAGQLVVAPAQDLPMLSKPIETPFGLQRVNEIGAALSRPILRRRHSSGNGAGSVSGNKQPEPLVPGSAVARCWFAAIWTLRLPAP